MTARPFGLRDDPFVEGHDRRFVYAHRTLRAAVERLTLAIGQGVPFALVTGASGAGKTMTMLAALAGAGARPQARVTATPALTVAELRASVLEAIGAPADAAHDAAAFAAALSARDATASVPVLAIDEAQDLDDATLLEIRGLSNLEAHGRKALIVLLVGGPALESRLERPEHEALRQRIAVRCTVESLGARETEAMLHHRVAVCGGSGALFPRVTCRAIHQLTHGVAREVQSLAAEALAKAHEAHAPAVHPEHVAAAARALGFRSVLDAGAADPASPAPAPVLARAAASSDDAPVAADTPAPAASEPPRPVSTPAVEAWVSRFRDPGGPPRIGSRVATEEPPLELPRRRPVASEPVAGPADADVAQEEAVVAPARPHEKRRPGRGRVVGRGRLRPSRHARRDHTGMWIAVLLVAGAVGAFVLLRHRHPVAGPATRAGTHAPSAGSTTPPEGTSSLVPGTELARSAASLPRTSVTRLRPGLGAAAATTPTHPGRPAAVTAGVDSVAANHRYMIVVGSYLVEDRAQAERDRVATFTPLGCHVVKGQEDGADVYRILVGPLPTRREADRAGEQLFSQGAVNEASVMRWSGPDPVDR